VARQDDPSFPSGHAAGAFAFAGFLAMELVREPRRRSPRNWLLVGVLFTVALGIALSRVVLGVHFPSDVTAGAAIGGLIGAATSRMAKRAETETEPES
jgi:undecaprenyl-diphosphatase